MRGRSPRPVAPTTGTGSDIAGSASGTSVPPTDRLRATLAAAGFITPANLPRFRLVLLPRSPGRRPWVYFSDVGALAGDFATGAVVELGGGS